MALSPMNASLGGNQIHMGRYKHVHVSILMGTELRLRRGRSFVLAYGQMTQHQTQTPDPHGEARFKETALSGLSYIAGRGIKAPRLVDQGKMRDAS